MAEKETPDDAFLVRPALADDADGFLLLCQALDRETEFMMLEPGERTDTSADVRRRLGSLADKKNSALWIVENDGHLVGYAWMPELHRRQ